MRIFGLDITVRKALTSVDSNRGWFPLISESYAGAWQQGVELTAETMLTHAAVFACVSLISSDIGKLPIEFTKREGAIWKATAHDYDRLLRKPNPFQNRSQFFAQWITSKLLHGNTYVLKRRDSSGQVVGLFILDPTRVKTLIATDGSVFYECRPADTLSGIGAEGITVPSRELIHDRGFTPFHPLVGLSPLTAAGLAANQGLAIQKNSAAFFGNASNPSGILSAPGSISDDTAKRLKEHWESNYTGAKSGRTAVLGDGLRYEAMSVSPVDAQLLEQLKWTAESVCMAFHTPAYKIGAGTVPTYGNAEVLNKIYYDDCLQALIESLELALDEGLDLPADERTELDTSALMRMDTVTRFTAYTAAIGGGWMAPNEARQKEGLPPVEGGDSVYLQVQNYSLAALANRDKKELHEGIAQ